MQPRQVWANLPVTDTTRTAAFYAALGFTPNGNPTDEIASFRFGEQGFVIHFFRRDKLEVAMGGKAVDAGAGNEVIFSLSAFSEEEVKTWAAKAKASGGSVIKEAARQADGYFYCVFADPDGHKFNALLIEEEM